MVRNTQGGSKTKSMARKSATDSNKHEYIPTNPLEKYAVVEKMYGNGMCQVTTTDNDKLSLLCHIRGKFRGRSKKQNTISTQSIIVIGLREWESPYKNADLISVISTPNDPIIATNNKNGHKQETTDDYFTFSEEPSIVDNDFIQNTHVEQSIIVEEDEINIDDI